VLEVYPLLERVIQDVNKVFLSLKIVRDARGIKVDGIGNSPGKCHVKSSSSAPHGGYRPRKQGYQLQRESPYEDAKVGNTVKLKHLVLRAEAKETVGNQKWIKKEEVVVKQEEGELKAPSQPKKQTEPSP
jgi:hypothetical protein